MFEGAVKRSQFYGEYGVGASTEWVYANTDAVILAVETSPEWASRVSDGKNPERLKLELVDVGPVGQWGSPQSYEKCNHFAQYQDSIWRREQKPDTVLIDGRFRVACFLTSLLNAEPGSTIIFDDYIKRPHYHIVEQIVRPAETCGRQARFEVPANLDKPSVADLLRKFEYVMD